LLVLSFKGSLKTGHRESSSRRPRSKPRSATEPASVSAASGRFAVARHAGPHGDVDRTYAALGTYATAHGRDGTGPVRERYLASPLDTPDSTQWQTEVCWPLSGG
jgi:effector-binding domain-containing protein